MFCGIREARKKEPGFTLIELIISVTIFAIIIAALYSTFYMGLKVWRRGEEKKSLEKVRPALLKLEKELKNSLFYSNIQFEGTSSKMIFPLSTSGGQIYTITYNVDKDEESGFKELIRKEKKFSGGLKDTKEKLRRLIPSMRSIKFEYAYKTKGLSGDFEWQDNWDAKKQGDKLPKGIRVSLESNEDGEIYSKVIFLPHGELGVKK